MVMLGYAALCALLFFFQRSLIYFPQPRMVTAPESTLMLTTDDAELVVTVRPHEGPKAIVYFGGNAEDVSRNLDPFSKEFPDYALFLLHYRGYGGSSGSPNEEAMHRDAEALFDYVHSRHPETVIFGRSLGTGVAVRLASKKPASRLILVTPFDRLTDIGADAYPIFPVRWLMLDTYDSGAYAPDVAIPTTIIMAEFDVVIPRSSTEALYNRFKHDVAAMTLIPGAGHNNLNSMPAYHTALQDTFQ